MDKELELKWGHTLKTLYFLLKPLELLKYSPICFSKLMLLRLKNKIFGIKY